MHVIKSCLEIIQILNNYAQGIEPAFIRDQQLHDMGEKRPQEKILKQTYFII